MKLKKGNMFERADLDLNNMTNEFIIVTTNSVIKSNGELVMGKGSALELKKRYPHFPKIAGETIKKKYHKIWGVTDPYNYDISNYLFLMITNYFGIFQTKYSYSEPSELNLIQFSTRKLNEVACSFPNHVFNLSYPGIADGQLMKEVVEPMIKILPDNVHVWEL